MEKKEVVDNLQWTLGVVNEVLKAQRLKASYNYKDAQIALDDGVTNYVHPICRFIEASKVINFLFHICTSILFVFVSYKLDVMEMIWPVESIGLSLGTIAALPVLCVIFILTSYQLVKKFFIDRVVLKYIDRAIWNRKSKKYHFKKKYKELLHSIDYNMDRLKAQSKIHPDYWNRRALETLIKYFDHGRVTSLKEAINKYCEETLLSDLIMAIDAEETMVTW